MLVTIKPVLTARTVIKKGTGKCRWATEVTIYISNDLLVAAATLGGRATEDDALLEFARNPARFKKQKGWEMAEAMGLLKKKAA